MSSSVVKLTHPRYPMPDDRSYSIVLTDATSDERHPILSSASRPHLHHHRSGSTTTLNPSYNAIPPRLILHSQRSKPEPTPLPPARSSSALGSLLVFGSACTFSINAFLVRVAESRYNISTLAVSFLIFTVTSLVAFCYIATMVPFSTLRKSFCNMGHTRLLLLRGLCGALASATCYKSYELMPIGDAVAIYNVCPALTTITAFLILREHVGLTDIVSIVIGLTGAMLVANPSSDTSLSSARIVGCFCALGDALFSALAYTTVRFLGGKVHFSLSVGIVGVMGGLVAASIGGYSDLMHFINTDPHAAQAVIICSVSAALLFVAQSLLDKGLQFCPAGKAMLIRTLEVPFAYILGLTFLHEAVSASAAIGSGLVVMAACLIAVGPKR